MFNNSDIFDPKDWEEISQDEIVLEVGFDPETGRGLRDEFYTATLYRLKTWEQYHDTPQYKVEIFGYGDYEELPDNDSLEGLSYDEVEDFEREYNVNFDYDFRPDEERAQERLREESRVISRVARWQRQSDGWVIGFNSAGHYIVSVSPNEAKKLDINI